MISAFDCWQKKWIKHAYSHGFQCFSKCFLDSGCEQNQHPPDMLPIRVIRSTRFPATGMTGMSNYININQWNVITYPCTNFNGGLKQRPLKLGHGRVITSHIKPWIALIIHSLISDEKNMLGEVGPNIFAGLLFMLSQIPPKTWRNKTSL